MATVVTLVIRLMLLILVKRVILVILVILVMLVIIVIILVHSQKYIHQDGTKLRRENPQKSHRNTSNGGGCGR